MWSSEKSSFEIWFFYRPCPFKTRAIMDLDKFLSFVAFDNAFLLPLPVLPFFILPRYVSYSTFSLYSSYLQYVLWMKFSILTLSDSKQKYVLLRVCLNWWDISEFAHAQLHITRNDFFSICEYKYERPNCSEFLKQELL